MTDNMVKNQNGNKAIRASQIEMVRCYCTREGDWMVWGKLIGVKDGFNFGVWKEEATAKKHYNSILKQL